MALNHTMYRQQRGKIAAIEQCADHKNNRLSLHTRGDGRLLKGTGASMAKLFPQPDLSLSTARCHGRWLRPLSMTVR